MSTVAFCPQSGQYLLVSSLLQFRQVVAINKCTIKIILGKTLNTHVFPATPLPQVKTFVILFCDRVRSNLLSGF